MERNCAMVNNTSTEEEIELELGLSIGGGYQRPEKLKPIKKEPVLVLQTSNSNSDGSEAEKNHRHQNNNRQSCTRSSVSPSFVRDAEQEIDPQAKREIQAARRQEAKKKREEKQQRKRMCKGQNGDYVNEFEFDMKERICKRNKISDAGSGSNDEISNVNGKLTGEQSRDCNLFSNPMAYIASPMCPVMAMQNQLPPLQCVPVTNGFAYPYMMPCWAESRTGVGSERNVIRPVANRSLRPIEATSESVLSLSICSSSTVSENHSSTQQGGSNSDTISHSNVSLQEQNQKNDTKEAAEDGVSAHLLESAESINKSTNRIDQPASSDAFESTTAKPKEEPISETKPHNPSRNLLVSTPEKTPPVPNTLRETKGKPPMPVNSNPNTTPLPHMPCVSTTGNGPNGKTINGFLYRYTKTEVSIVCVCHGATFSPAEFVQHAGGTDLSQPLRHITVIPSAF
ncbi:putative UPF0737 protein AFP3 [Tripterygium wilfordii]|uniref:Ninja-family protein n=1 Tax=Tripterygium wilfordii TaxID=458696 RepID=A0A7J7D4T5_TRIWF|nr:ninja-family protein 6-like [Tripterygium wilfordii]KAF5741288.1 putative UPF0737 protein AFP3 [Tripterygium wilfordii]